MGGWTVSWTEVRLTLAQAASGEHVRIQDRFTTMFTLAKAPRDMVMLSSVGVLDDEMIHLYFSPATLLHAEAFLRLVGARACHRPPPDSALAVGHPDALDRLRAGEI